MRFSSADPCVSMAWIAPCVRSGHSPNDILAEFQISHDLGAKRGRTYPLPAPYVAALAGLAGVSEVIVIADEAHYLGPGVVHVGPGPRTLAAAALPQDAARIAAACLAGTAR